METVLIDITLNNNSLTFLLLSLGGELLQILSQQDQAVTDEDVGEPVAGAAAHLVGEADGAPTDGRDAELQDALAAETQHKVTVLDTQNSPQCRNAFLLCPEVSEFRFSA